jgi:glycosyltransferase involved in cell wall biosynthesis
MRATAPGITVVVNDMAETGGIARYLTWTIRALREIGPVGIVELRIDPAGGSPRAWAAAVTSAWRTIVRDRPGLLVLGHPSFSPVAAPQLLSPRAVVTLAYGIEVWGGPSRRIDFALDAVDQVWPISTFTAHEVRRRRPSARVGPVLGAGISREFFVDHSAQSGPTRVITVARLDDLGYKGIDTCVDAALLAAGKVDVELRVVGTGPARAELAELVEVRGARDLVTLCGAVDDEDLRRLYASADLAVLVSRFRRGAQPRGEGLGIVPLEAGAAGTPSAVSDVGGTVDTVVDGVTGWLVPPGDAEALSRVILAVADDRAAARRMGRRAREFVAEVHGADAFAGRVARAVHEVVR